MLNFIVGFVVGMIGASISWYYGYQKLNEEWADDCLRMNNEWADFCARIIKGEID